MRKIDQSDSYISRYFFASMISSLNINVKYDEFGFNIKIR